MKSECKDLKGAEFEACIYKTIYTRIKTIANNYEIQAPVCIAQIRREMKDFESKYGKPEKMSVAMGIFNYGNRYVKNHMGEF